VGLPAVLGIQDEIPPDFLINVLALSIPKKRMRNGLQVDGHGLETAPAVLGHGPVGQPPVVPHEDVTRPLFLKDFPLDGIEVIIPGKLNKLFLSHGFSPE
jgi:hypothetical protein